MKIESIYQLTFSVPEINEVIKHLTELRDGIKEERRASLNGRRNGTSKVKIEETVDPNIEPEDNLYTPDGENYYEVINVEGEEWLRPVEVESK